MTQQIGIKAERSNYEALGQKMFDLVAELFPICRSITGNGVRQTLGILNRFIPLSIEEVPSGTPVFDWTIPPEWNISDAYIKNERGERVLDFKKNNLHVLNYSVPIRTKLPLDELKKHIFTLPDQPDLIPYRTSYYAERWGFCMSQNQLDDLQPGTYEAVVESSLTEGSLTYAEHVVPGATKDEVLLSAHICHPSLANDNCSGLALLTTLAQELRRRKTKFTYRFIFAPGTIGAIAWLARNEANVGRIKHGLVVSCVGDAGGPTYKKAVAGTQPSTERLPIFCAITIRRQRSKILHRTVTMNGNTARPGSTCPSGCSSEASMAHSKNITRRATTSISSSLATSQTL